MGEAEASPRLRYEPTGYRIELTSEWLDGRPVPEALAPLFERRRLRGRELDLWVSVDDERVGMSAWVDLRGEVRVERVVSTCGELPAADLRADLGLRLSGEAGLTWTPELQAVVADAYLRIDPVLRERVADVALHRARRGPPHMVARYEPAPPATRVVLFERALEADAWNFVGPTSCPRPASLLSVLHELAHAIADAPRRELAAHWRDGVDPERTAAASRQLSRLGPVLDAYAAVAPRHERAVTDYARRNLHESFAESFALYYADPDALRRVAPTVWTWFSADGPARALADWDATLQELPMQAGNSG